jgi:hypothetical protein
MSYYVIKQTKEKIEHLEELLNNPETSEFQKEHLPKTIASYKRKLEILENHTEDLDKVRDDMKIIMSHTNAIDDKYNCRTVKFMFRLADFLEKYISVSMGKWIANYTVHNIHAPVCSIVAGTKPELPPMPQYSDPIESKYEEWRKGQDAEMQRFRQITVDFLEKPPTFKERIQIKYQRFVKKFLPQHNS